MRAWLLHLSYRWQRHYFLGWRLSVWLLLLPLPVWLWLGAGLLQRWEAGFLFACTWFGFGLTLFIWAARQRYLYFEPTDVPPPIAVAASIAPFEDVPLRAGGDFAVGGQTCYFVDEPAFYRRFETNERALMLRRDYTRFWWLAESRPELAGWWYVFLKPEHVLSIQPGLLHQPSQPRPALALTYRPPEAKDPLILYLSFADSAAQTRFWADFT